MLIIDVYDGNRFLSQRGRLPGENNPARAFLQQCRRTAGILKNEARHFRNTELRERAAPYLKTGRQRPFPRALWQLGHGLDAKLSISQLFNVR